MSSSRLIRGDDSSARVVAWRAPEVPGQAAGGRRAGENELTALQQRAWQEGFDQGRAAGVEAGTRELAVRVQSLERVLDAFARPLEDLDHRVEQELLALVQAVVRQLVRRELHHDPAHLLGIIREGLGALPLGAGEIIVRLNPRDAEALRETLPPDSSDRAWRLEADPLLEAGGCLIASERSNIDARLDARLSRVIAGLLEDERDAGS